MDKGKYYITTAIAYTSRIPHIGNVYEAILTDVIARQKRAQGYDVYFLTGTDEHGEKIATTASEEGRTPQEHVDYIAGEIKRIWKLVDVDFDQFIRTSDVNHKKVVQHIFKKLYEQGDIYKSKYEGWYCTPDESFWTQTQLVDGKCPDCGREVKWATEEAYFLKLSKYADRLVEYYESHPDFVLPAARKTEMINNFIKPGLQDLCVSRTSFDWGVPVDFDEGHVVYVWIDALSNYITAIGYDVEEQSEQFKKLWPADLHVIGKDIVRFHIIYWPIILMALGLELPKKVFGHGWLLSGLDKMSKSRGNVLYTDDLVEKYGVDAIRYYVLKEMPFQDDGSITDEMIVSRYNTDLANILGNLVNRTISMVHKYFDGEILGDVRHEALDDEIVKQACELHKLVEHHVDRCEISLALEKIWDMLKRLNKYIDETTPWVLAKSEEDRDRLASVMYHLIEGIRICAVNLAAFMPGTSASILEQLNSDAKEYESTFVFGATKPNTKVGQAKVLFQRLQ